LRARVCPLILLPGPEKQSGDQDQREKEEMKPIQDDFPRFLWRNDEEVVVIQSSLLMKVFSFMIA